MFMSKVKALFADSISFDLICAQLLAVINNDFLNFFVNALDVMLAALKPLLFAVILEFEYRVGDHSVD